MQRIEQTQAIRVVGLELRTHNGEAHQTIPPFWAKVMAERVAEHVPGRIGDVLYAVYTNFENAGRDNLGLYSLIIGVAVSPQADVPPGMAQATLACGPRAVFEVERGRPDLLGAAWQAIWQRHDLPKAFIADYERYDADGRIEIGIGLRE